MLARQAAESVKPRWPSWAAVAKQIAAVLRDHGPQSFRQLLAYIPDVASADAMNGVAWLDLNGWAKFDHGGARAWELTVTGRTSIRDVPRTKPTSAERRERRTCSGNPRGKKPSAKTVSDCELVAAWLLTHPWSTAGEMWRARVFADRRTLDYTLGFMTKRGKVVARGQRYIERNVYALSGTVPQVDR